MLAFGSGEKTNYIVLPIYGPSLKNILKIKAIKSFSLKTVAMIGIQLVK